MGEHGDEVPAVIHRAMSLLVNAARVSPPLVDAARAVERYIHDVTVSREWWMTERADAISLDLAALTAERDRLRAALTEIAEYGGGDGGDWVGCCEIARAALDPQEASE